MGKFSLGHHGPRSAEAVLISKENQAKNSSVPSSLASSPDVPPEKRPASPKQKLKTGGNSGSPLKVRSRRRPSAEGLGSQIVPSTETDPFGSLVSIASPIHDPAH